MARNFSTNLLYDRQKHFVVFIPLMKSDGMHYEVNIKSFPRFEVAWSTMGRYDIVADADGEIPAIPYELILAVSDVLEKRK
jgi:hypothetical protein